MTPKFNCELNPIERGYGVRQSAIAVHTPTSLCQVYGVFFHKLWIPLAYSLKLLRCRDRAFSCLYGMA